MNKIIYTLFFFFATLYAEENIDNLLLDYQDESKLSNITKDDLAGFLQVFTRDDLERMQAHTLMDIMKILPNYSINSVSDNEYVLSSAGSTCLQSEFISLYINNHKINLVTQYSNMSIENIDHIEIYNIASSVEMGGESAPMVIKLYTKSALHDEGNKVSISESSNAELNANLYTAATLDNDFSYFGFVSFVKEDKTDVTHEYSTQEYTGKYEKDNYLAYASLENQTIKIELSHFTKKADEGLGVGDYKTPSDGGYNNSALTYLHLTKDFSNNITLDIGLTHSSVDKNYIDFNQITLYEKDDGTFYKVDRLKLEQDTDQAEIFLAKKINIEDNHILIGSRFELNENSYDTLMQDSSFSDNLQQDRREYKTSLMLEDKYTPSDSLKIITSATVDFYRYKDSSDYEDEYMFRLGGVKSYENYQFRFFSSYRYIDEKKTPFSFFVTNDEEVEKEKKSDYKYGIGVKRFFQKSELEIIYGVNRVDGDYQPTQILHSTGICESSDTTGRYGVEIHYNYFYDKENKIYFTYYQGDTEADLDASPKSGINVMMFNRYQKFDLYNELIYKGRYKRHDVRMPRTYLYTSAIKYHYSKDLSFIFKGDNIFNKSSQTCYYMYDSANIYDIDVYDRKVTFGMEYLF